MGISSLLPKPKQSSSKWDDNSDEEAPQEPLKHLKSTGPPPYGKRSSFVPKSLQVKPNLSMLILFLHHRIMQMAVLFRKSE